MSEAWLMGEKIGRRRGFPVDFLNKSDQDQVLGWLNCEWVRYADKQVRYAVKLDKDWDNQDAESAIDTLARLLTAPQEFDPAIQLELRQEGLDPFALIRYSYSQAAAYFILLDRFDWRADDLAEHLHIVVTTLKARIRWFGAWISYQPSLFDRIQCVEQDFDPLQARRCVSRTIVEADGCQLAWPFGD